MALAQPEQTLKNPKFLFSRPEVSWKQENVLDPKKLLSEGTLSDSTYDEEGGHRAWGTKTPVPPCIPLAGCWLLHTGYQSWPGSTIPVRSAATACQPRQ